MFTIFEKLGGVNAAFDIIERRTKKRPSPRAYKYWRSDKKLPFQVRVALIAECVERGVSFDPDFDFIFHAEERRKAS